MALDEEEPENIREKSGGKDTPPNSNNEINVNGENGAVNGLKISIGHNGIIKNGEKHIVLKSPVNSDLQFH